MQYRMNRKIIQKDKPENSFLEDWKNTNIKVSGDKKKAIFSDGKATSITNGIENEVRPHHDYA